MLAHVYLVNRGIMLSDFLVAIGTRRGYPIGQYRVLVLVMIFALHLVLLLLVSRNSKLTQPRFMATNLWIRHCGQVNGHPMAELVCTAICLRCPSRRYGLESFRLSLSLQKIDDHFRKSDDSIQRMLMPALDRFLFEVSNA